MRLIDADKLKAHYAWWGNDGAEYRERKADFDVIVDLQPTVEPIKHGHWKWNKQYGTECSECGTAMFEVIGHIFSSATPKYCPYCGARMDAQIGEDKSHPFAESVIMGKDGGEE